MSHPSSMRRMASILPLVLAYGLAAGCGEGSQTSAPPQMPPTQHGAAPTGKQSAKDKVGAGRSDSGTDSTQQPPQK